MTERASNIVADDDLVVVKSAGRELSAQAEAELVNRAQAGNVEAFGQLVLAHQDRLYNVVYRLCSKPDVAEELAQEMLNATPFGLRMTKEVLNVNVDAPGLVAAAELENRTQILCSFTADAREAGRASFFEKRRPVYHDR